MQEEEVTLKYNVPAAPPGATKPRATGSDEFAPLDADAYVGPAGTNHLPSQLSLVHLPTADCDTRQRRHTLVGRRVTGVQSEQVPQQAQQARFPAPLRK